MPVPFLEGVSPEIHAAACRPLLLEPEAAWQAALAKVGDERPSLAQREASGARLLP